MPRIQIYFTYIFLHYNLVKPEQKKTVISTCFVLNFQQNVSDICQERNWVFVTNSDFLIPIYLQQNVVDLRYFNLWFLSDLSLKYQRFTPSGFTYIEILKYTFVAKSLELAHVSRNVFETNLKKSEPAIRTLVLSLTVGSTVVPCVPAQNRL